jgi:hypothetical protein
LCRFVSLGRQRVIAGDADTWRHERLAELDRYGSGHLVSRSIQRATPMILRAVEQVHQRAAQTA